MEEFRKHRGVTAPLLIDNIDTDQIIPSREMKRVSKEGLGDGLFAGWRYHYDGTTRTGLRDDFVLNRPEYHGASVLLGGANWGCGSSREHAVWALREYGIRAIIAESFGRIFYRNCARNGLLAIELGADAIGMLANSTKDDPQRQRLLIDLESCEIVTPQQDTYSFSVPESDRNMLLRGLDYIDFTLQFEGAIESFVADDRKHRNWAYL